MDEPLQQSYKNFHLRLTKELMRGNIATEIRGYWSLLEEFLNKKQGNG
ncbi:MAG: hypothetical protein KME57_11045 [Scytonema hyalinum WJT4-NPBG1]|nr:hypothetical protein [Scytonema hyalinum WJT4-NPBG1]